MCDKCDELFNRATGLLDMLLKYRRKGVGYHPEFSTSGQFATCTASNLIDGIASEDLRHNKAVIETCLALSAAVERLIALEQSGMA